MTTEQIQRHRKERRAIPPFGDGKDPNTTSKVLDNLLAKSRFTPFPNVGLDDIDTYFLSSDEATRALKPKFKIDVNQVDELTNRLGLREEDIEVGMSIRSRYLRRYQVLQRWNIASIPHDPWSPAPEKIAGLQSERGMDFILAVRVVATRKQLILQGLDPNKVLARRVFSVKENVESFTFPFRWVKFGEGTGYPEELLWVIEWNELDDEAPFERPVGEVLMVLVNEKAESSLRAMNEVHGSNDLGWRMLAADITTQLWADVLSKTENEPNEEDHETLAGQVFARLSRASGIPYSDLKSLVGQDDSLEELRSLVARILNVVK